MLVICHNNGVKNPPEEAVSLFESGTKFRHFHSHRHHDGYMFWAQVDVAGSENLAVTRPEQLQWVEFNGYKIGG